jgi:hypothetical protein
MKTFLFLIPKSGDNKTLTENKRSHTIQHVKKTFVLNQ